MPVNRLARRLALAEALLNLDNFNDLHLPLLVNGLSAATTHTIDDSTSSEFAKTLGASLRVPDVIRLLRDYLVIDEGGVVGGKNHHRLEA